jgi:hypothetical protein
VIERFIVYWSPGVSRLIAKPVYQRPNDLVLGIIETEIEQPITILAQKAFRMRDWLLTFHIIGESHLIRVERDGRLLFQEILACIPLHASTCRHHHSFTDLDAHHYSGKNYSTDVSFAPEVQMSGIHHHHSLRMIFPQVYGQTPITQVSWSTSESLIVWETLHIYPDRDGITAVHSRSQLNCALLSSKGLA